MSDQKISDFSPGAPAQAGDEYVIVRSGNNYRLTLTNIAASMPPIGATTPSSGTFTSLATTTLSASGTLTVNGNLAANSSLTAGGNLLFSGTGQRILGDMSNTTVASRVLFQTTTTNGQTRVSAIPNGTATTAAWMAFNNSDPANCAIAQTGVSGSRAFFSTTATGTGTALPFDVDVNGANRLRILTTGQIGTGGNTAPIVDFEVGVNNSTPKTIGVRHSSVPAFISNTFNGANKVSATFSCNAYDTSNGTTTWSASTNTLYGISAIKLLSDTLESGIEFQTAATANTAPTTRIAINGSGAVEFFGNTGMGRSGSSLSRLFIKGASNTSADFGLVVWNSDNNDLLNLRNDGRICTGQLSLSPFNNTTGSGANMYVDSGGFLYRSTSSLRYKANVTDATHGLADVLKLRSVTYKGKTDGDLVFGGLIAEEVHDAGLTEFVAYDNEGRPDALHYGNMVALAFKAIQELKAENDALKARIEVLEAK